MHKAMGRRLLGQGVRLQGRPGRQTSLLLSRRSWRRCLLAGDAAGISSKQQQLGNANSSRASTMTREVLADVPGDPACTCTP